MQQREQRRRVDTPGGTLEYTLVRKRVKNLNLRLDGRGGIRLSVPWGCPAERADRLVRDKSGWILAHCPDPGTRPPLPPLPPEGECRALLLEAVERVYPLVSGAGVPFPRVKVRRMRSQWGNCHFREGYITLNTALCRCPEELRDYVALHELVHFLHPDHGPGFYAAMEARLPAWRERRAALRRLGAALTDPEG